MSRSELARLTMVLLVAIVLAPQLSIRLHAQEKWPTQPAVHRRLKRTEAKISEVFGDI